MPPPSSALGLANFPGLPPSPRPSETSLTRDDASPHGGELRARASLALTLPLALTLTLSLALTPTPTLTPLS